MNPLSENFILNGIGTVLGNILSYINPFSENFFVYKLIELLGNLLKSLFVPSEVRITGLINSVSMKFSFVDSIKQGVNSLINVVNNIGNLPTLTITIPATRYTSEFNFDINFSWFAQFKTYTDLILTAFIYVMFLWRLFIKLPGIISGSVGDVVDFVNKGGIRK